ncbi:cytosolic phospholipase A2 gamma-like [Engraulis encrasicolus]|uniref:cytosolic phospholipase A2 gamma-like n=1 Tax=Engraulis encrasicolus TaxID=184585 RepID=UPI002FCE9C86
MPNILYNLQDSRVPKNMCEEDIMHVIDAGLYLNSPYPPMLGRKRGIDLIISFDFSSGDPFETVDVASRYAKTCKVPFPKINLEGTDDDCPKSLHIFEEKGKPTVIHIPLFNVDNCKDREGVKRERKEYATFQRPYRGMEKINHLADLAGQNVKVNKEAILKEIRKVARN